MGEHDARRRRGGEGADGQERRRGTGRSGGQETTPVEWAVAVASALVVLAAIGFLVYGAVTGAGTPPEIRVRVERIVPQPHGFVVEFRARNTGGTTAAGVPIRGRLLGAEGEVESAETTIDYVPPESERRGGLFFQNDPRRYRVEIRAEGYDVP